MDGVLPDIACRAAQCTPCRQERSPAWARDGGRRHFFILTNDRGPCCLDGRYKDVGFMRHHIIANGARTAIRWTTDRAAARAHEPMLRVGERDDAARLHQFTDKLDEAPRLPCHDRAKDLAIPTPNLHYPRVSTDPPLRPNATARAVSAAPAVNAGAGFGVADAAVASMGQQDRSLLIFFAGNHPSAECRLVRASRRYLGDISAISR